MQDIYLVFLGGLLLVGTIIRAFRPHFLLPDDLHHILNDRGTKKKYLISKQVNGTLLGSVLILAGYLPETKKISICMPLLALTFVSVLICNKICVGKFWSKK